MCIAFELGLLLFVVDLCLGSAFIKFTLAAFTRFVLRCLICVWCCDFNYDLEWMFWILICYFVVGLPLRVRLCCYWVLFCSRFLGLFVCFVFGLFGCSLVLLRSDGCCFVVVVYSLIVWANCCFSFGYVGGWITCWLIVMSWCLTDSFSYFVYFVNDVVLGIVSFGGCELWLFARY